MSKERTAVVYARYSSHKQGEQSIEGQLAEAYKYAAAHDLQIVHEYVDHAMTGRNDNREQFQKMLKDTDKRQFGAIILWKIDRFGRNREEIAFNKYRCKKNGVKVVYVAESIPDSPEGVILESVLEGMAEYYSLQLSQNVQRGMRVSAEKCQCVGGNIPLGYRVDPQTKKFVVDPETAPTVQLIFDLYVNGMTVTEVITELNKRGLRTRKGAPFTVNSLHRLLSSEKYIGVYTYKDLVRVEGGMPRLIDDETFAKARELSKQNKRAPARTWNRTTYLLSDKLFCGHCGARMVGESGTSQTGAKHNYYICTKRKKEHACNKKAVRQDWIENIVLNNVIAVLKDDEVVKSIADGVYAAYKKQQSDDDSFAVLQSKLREVETAQANITKAVEAGLISPVLKTRLEELDKQHAELEAELAKWGAIRANILTRDQILYFLCAMRDNAARRDVNCQKRLVAAFVNAIFVYDDKITITLNYSGDNRTITLAEAEGFESQGVSFVCDAPSFTIAHRYELRRINFVVWRNVFAITVPVN